MICGPLFAGECDGVRIGGLIWLLVPALSLVAGGLLGELLFRMTQRKGPRS
jgi:hypothetical protein